MSDHLLQWCLEQLQRNFDLEASEDIVKYIISIEKAEEIEEYVGDLLQGTDGRKGQFIQEFLCRWKKTQRQAGDTSGLFLLKESTSTADSQDITKDFQKKSKRKGRNKQEVLTVSQTEPEPEAVKTPIDVMKVQENSAYLTKKKNKFTSLYCKEGQDKLTVILPGQHSCECLAQKHRLINNCISCGRIVCEQEGSGPCLFCSKLVCTKEEEEILLRDSNKSQKLRKKLMGDCGERDYPALKESKMKAGLEKAIQHKEKLLEYDRNSVKRTQVLDDESDYFATESNQWLSATERDKLRKKEEELRELRHASRKDRKITLDFAGRQVIEERSNLNNYYNELDETLKAMNSTLQFPVYSERQGGKQNLRELLNPNIKQSAPEWVDVLSDGNNRRNMQEGQSLAQDKKEDQRSRLRLQDKELQEMSDGGWCLSMHQPWASLLVKGIKRVEGRTWYTAHRGRLWISAAAKKPTPQEIAEVEAMYRCIYQKEPTFPSAYPTGCLLGCVNVSDCLSQEEFKEQFPSACEESASPFVFICSSPQELLVKFPMKGKHKIWKLESHYHQGAKKGLVASTAD
uniref:activating signal cointegrator 1 isoform X2 n=1 Tax=Doryrhamphus excisus TaxID=161450 RepID=UPI0025AEA65B|nr:activating signal cointegrator 1 isoform X2 [Doryrhamphus excisus]XP_057945729.1 activating signal cointegrator 1 isoform X2 [Doryrhamphus excisus]XP_057945730.1 activating signal cointegrator 1 isoform X2 [Doryrhamphus excisus]XP_057945731.1 activating signal cointegrator 1 isoform X2 [Doryrhamphus excisus]